MTTPQPTAGDTKDWTWTTERPCPDCRFDPAGVPDTGLGAALRATTARWQRVLERNGVRDRPAPQVWSPLEYACHVRDVHGVMRGRVELMLAQEGPGFANWDQDEAAVTGQYWTADPAEIAREIAAATEDAAAAYDAIPANAWGRSGLRGDGGKFTISSLGRYHLHDVIHHLHDVDG